MPTRPRPSPTLLTRVRKDLVARFIDLEYRLRVSRPFTHGAAAPRVFFPGCALPAADPDLVLRAYTWLRERDPDIVLWSDCCGKPLEKFGDGEAAERGRARTRRLLREGGTTEIITACGNCTVHFDSLEVPGLKLTSLYGVLAEADWGPRPASGPTVVHHPCSARIDKAQQGHFRELSKKLALDVVNADSRQHPLACCLHKNSSAMDKRKALDGQKVVTYCAHCTMAFQKDVPTRHVLQEVFGSEEERWRPRGKAERFAQYRRLTTLARAAERATALTGPSLFTTARRWAPVGLVAAAILGLLAFGREELAAASSSLITWIQGAGVTGMAAYVLTYVVATVLLLPGSVLTLGAGFAWGPLWGVAMVVPTSVAAATAAFLLGRTVLRPHVERRVRADPRFLAIDRAVGESGLKLVILLRLSPVLPFNLLNYALALTRVSLRDYVLGSAIGMVPAITLFVYIGSLLEQGAGLLGARPSGGMASALVNGVGLVATVAVVVYLTRMARGVLRDTLAEPDATPIRVESGKR